MATCIYCRGSTGPFTREHVVQEAFGKFQNALVIRDAVCHECNQEFGRTIDLNLSRSSVEGLDRYRFGVKEPAEIEKFKYDAVSLRAKNAGDFADARFEQRADASGKKLVARLLPGVAIHRKNGEGFVHLTEAQIADGTWLQNPELDWRRGIKVYGEKNAEERIRAVLRGQGVVPTQWRPLVPPQDREVTVEQEFEVTPQMQRAFAKIAFNYLAYCEGPEYALLGEFDGIRKFIRYGERPASSLPPVISHPGLPFSKIDAGKVVLRDGEKRPVVHFVSLRSNTERNVVGAITLFAFMTHRVMLAEAFPGRLPTPHAHLYNIAMKRVGELGLSPE